VVAAPEPAPSAPAPAPVPTYVVKRGDTLRQIANELGIETRDLAAWNNIGNANVIRVGQVLRLSPPGSEFAAAPAQAATPAGTTITPLRSAPPPVAGDAKVDPPTPAASAPAPAVAAAPPPSPAPRASDAMTRVGPKAVKEPWSDQAMRDVARTGGGLDAAFAKAEPRPPPAPVPAPAAATPAPPAAAPPPQVATAPPASSPAPGPSPGDDDGLDWVWPAKGKLIAQFSESASLKGIDIAGSAGDAVVASAPGRVVYAGSGLRGYGKLVIIKHNATYLTAYAHNRDIVVKEGQQVTRGQKIAEMGSTDAERVKLHFEIRRLGKPMDPLRFLPPA
jgi:lipoprotein NlpD